MAVPKKGDRITLNQRGYEQWRVFIAREGHAIRLDERGKVLLDGAPATEYRVERNYLFGMGDHRDNSLDGRFWGFIPEDNIVGTPMIVYWSWDPDLSIFNIIEKIASVRPGRIGTIIQ
jgi:signal peptidase I